MTYDPYNKRAIAQTTKEFHEYMLSMSKIAFQHTAKFPDDETLDEIELVYHKIIKRSARWNNILNDSAAQREDDSKD